jgi:uncharacterized membrane protein
MVDRALDKIRQAGGGMPAVVIRLLDAITRVVEHTVETSQREVLRRQADMILRAADDAITEPNDRADIHTRHDHLVSTIVGLDEGEPGDGPAGPDWPTPSLSGRLAVDR